MKFFILSLIFLLSACGITSNSSANSSTNGGGTDGNGTDGNNTGGGVDGNNTGGGVDGNNTGGGTDNNDSIFDKGTAIFDEKACGAFTGFIVGKDNGLSPEGFRNAKHGIEIVSELPSNFNPTISEVTLYHPKLIPPITEVNATAQYTIVSNEKKYYISFDNNVWLKNEKQTVYVKTPKNSDGKYSCYRHILNSATASDITTTKVYR
jgi:hypothetical protein